MARNMWTFIDRELAKLEQQTSGDPYVDAMKEARQLHKEKLVWDKQKNEQRLNIMSELARGTSMTFNDKDLGIKKERYQRYFNKIKGDLDEES